MALSDSTSEPKAMSRATRWAARTRPDKSDCTTNRSEKTRASPQVLVLRSIMVEVHYVEVGISGRYVGVDASKVDRSQNHSA